MNFQFYSPTKLIVGAGKAAAAGDIAGEFAKTALVIYSQSLRQTSIVFDSLRSKGIKIVEYKKPSGEPDVETVDAAADAARRAQCGVIVSIGGGSTIDLAKAAAGLASNGGSVVEYLEEVGTGRQVVKPALPHIALPTTAGTGAEVTKNAVISSRTGRFKKSFRSPYLFPAVAILDAQLTESLPPQQAAYSGMDAITQLIEAFLTRKATPITDALALHGLELALPSIHDVCREGSSIEARENMLLASTLSGICLANAGLGLAHGFASGLGALYDIPHGKACAILLPHAMRINLNAAQAKLARIGALFSNSGSANEEALADRAVKVIEQLTAELGIPADLKSLRIPTDELDLLAKMSMGNSMRGNLVEITQELAKELLSQWI
ncbi:MAG: iron-containing alcohol dehydrogenase [Candidatus Omnitrophota bacterium]